MNIDLSKIIRESIDDLICDDIISEAIDNVANKKEQLNEAQSRGRKATRRHNNKIRHDREIAELIKAAKKLGIQDEDIKNLGEVELKNLVKQAKEENKNKNLAQTGPVKTDDVEKLNKDSSVDGVDTHTGIVDSSTSENPEGKGPEIPVVDGEAPADDNEGTPANSENPTIMPTIENDGESVDGEKPTTGDGEALVDDGKPANGEENQNEEVQEAAKQLLEKYDFKKYSDKLRQLIGNGIDPQPVADDKNAVQFVQQFNQFLFAVINAIESGNLLREPSTGGNGKNAAQFANPYTKSKYDGFYSALHSLLTTGAETFDQAVGATDLTNAVFGGMGAAFNKGYHQMVNATNDFINNRAYLQSMANNNAAAGGNAKQGLSLSDLMLPNGCQYIIMLGSYQNVNSSSNNKLNTIAVIPQAFQVLEALREELYRFQQEAQQTAQKVAQQNGGNQREDGQQGENDGKPRPNYSKYAKEINKFANKLEGNRRKIEKLNSDLADALFSMAEDLSKNVITAINNGVYYTEDNKDGNTLPLTLLMSLNGEDDPNQNTYNAVAQVYSNLNGQFDDDPKSGNKVKNYFDGIISTFANLRNQMTADKVIENDGASGGSSGEEPGVEPGGASGEESYEKEEKFYSKVKELHNKYGLDGYGHSDMSKGEDIFREEADKYSKEGDQEEAKNLSNIADGLKILNELIYSMLNNGLKADESVLNNWYNNLVYARKIYEENDLLNERNRQSYIKTYEDLSNFYEEIRNGEYK